MKLFQPLIVVVVGLVLLSCNNPNHNSNQTAPKAKVNIVSNKVYIDYTDSGTGDTTLLFVHGWCINKTYWSAQVKHFDKRYRVVTIDLPGFGRSGKNRSVWTPLPLEKI